MELKNNIFEEINIKNIGKNKIALMAIAGIILIMTSYVDFSKSDKNNDKKTCVEKTKENNDYVHEMEKKLEELINTVDGAGKCTVMITVKSTNEKVLQQDKEISNKSQSGDRNVTESSDSSKTLVLKEDDRENPYIVKEIMPEIEGVVVVAKGAGDKKVNGDIVKIIQALFNVKAHKISIIKMK